MKKFTEFTKEHVGENVSDITLGKGKIVCFTEGRDYPVQIQIKDRSICSYTRDGRVHSMDKFRSLYFGHKIKVEVTGEEVPEPKLICPVCGVEHEIEESNSDNQTYVINNAKRKCPLHFSDFSHDSHFISAMKNLIKAMEPK